MSFEELTKRRQSCRNFMDKPVEREKIEKMLSVARLTPSACNSQPWRLHVVYDSEKVKEFEANYQFLLLAYFHFDHKQK